LHHKKIFKQFLFFFVDCRTTFTFGAEIIEFTTSLAKRMPTLTTPGEGFSLLMLAGCYVKNIRKSYDEGRLWMWATFYKIPL